MELESWQSCRMCGRDACDGYECVDRFEPEPEVGWAGPWLLALALLIGSIVLWHLLGAPVWEGGF